MVSEVVEPVSSENVEPVSEVVEPEVIDEQKDEQAEEEEKSIDEEVDVDDGNSGSATAVDPSFPMDAAGPPSTEDLLDLDASLTIILMPGITISARGSQFRSGCLDAWSLRIKDLTSFGVSCMPSILQSSVE